MKIAFTNKYEKQFDRLNDIKLRKQIIAAVKTILAAQRIEAIPSIKKLKGFTTETTQTGLEIVARIGNLPRD